MAHFKIFQAAAERRLNVKLVTLRIDSASELVEGEFQRYCKAEGIGFKKIVPDAFPQNGVAERANRTTACMARAFLLNANMSSYFWPLAVQAAVHIKNQVPHSALPPHVTPYEIWFGEKPDLSHLRPFGCKVTARITTSDSLNKMEARGKTGFCVGYAPDVRGYLIWFPYAKAICVRRDVTFHGMPDEIVGPVPMPDGGKLWDDLTIPNWDTTKDQAGRANDATAD